MKPDEWIDAWSKEEKIELSPTLRSRAIMILEEEIDLLLGGYRKTLMSKVKADIEKYVKRGRYNENSGRVHNKR